MTAQISVLLPAYKPNPMWLRAAITSLNAQSYPHWQLVLSLDGDDPETLAAAEIARKALATGHALIIVQGGRSGIAGALNRGLAVCDTPYTARLDADDLCRRLRLQQQWELLESDHSLVACGMQIQSIDANAKPKTGRSNRYPTTPTTTMLAGAILNTPIAHPVLMVRTEKAQRLGGYRPLPCMEDYDLMSRLCSLGDLTNLDVIGLDYRVHNNQHSQQLRPKRSDLITTRCRFLRHLVKKQPTAIALISIPLALYFIGPQAEYKLRRLLSCFYRLTCCVSSRHYPIDYFIKKGRT
jgi:glycosyltransferase involved in cell wall biosynthesis